ncbi:Charged multivesicular body protein [Lachnellula subtilissima]|uniref:Charged multivesicular body protein n=1 Tax=Lachnellula subtilissima TaxID=602034 RepID=A0A8H8UDU5_9HELO|nr:Charged multivesicular body protein [Lachnellula subtilissima]
MNRLFGAKSSTPKPNLGSAIKNVDERVESIDVKLAAINAELQGYQTKLSKMRDGPGKTAIKQKALKVLQRRKMYEGQRDQLQQQSWNMEQAGMMQDNLKNVMTTVDAMKTTNKSLKQQYGKINIDKIERMQDEMADLMEVGNDIQESISRSYDIPEDVDEAELDAELEALGMRLSLRIWVRRARRVLWSMKCRSLLTSRRSRRDKSRRLLDDGMLAWYGVWGFGVRERSVSVT